MTRENSIQIKTLKEQIYDYLRLQLKQGELRPGSLINVDMTCKKLGVSKSPLRDALLQLEMEGFVTIHPRRGVEVNSISLEDIKHLFQVIGSLEGTAILACREHIKAPQIRKMRKLNEDMKKAIAAGKFVLYMKKNVDFHNSYLELCGNPILVKTVHTLKKRLYDFTWPDYYIKEWEEILVKEHEQVVDLMEAGKFSEAAGIIRDVHWSFQVQEKFVRAVLKM